MLTKHLTQAGLNENQAKVYQVLLERGGLLGGEISVLSGLGRALTYKILNDLEEKDLIFKEKSGQVYVFFVKNPQRMIEKIKRKEKKLRQARENLNSQLSNFNALHFADSPKIYRYNGLNGVKKVLDDSLINNSSKEIFSFLDMEKYANHINNFHKIDYQEKRKKLKIKKRIITLNKQANQKIAEKKKDGFTKIKFSDHKNYPSNMKVNVYDNKVAFLNLSEHNPHGIIIESKEIFNTLKSMFLNQWLLLGSR